MAWEPGCWPNLKKSSFPNLIKHLMDMLEQVWLK